MPRVLITGAAGFVGRHVVDALEPSWSFAVLERPGTPLHFGDKSPDAVLSVQLGQDDIDPHQLEGYEAVLHLAARAHILKETATDPMEEFMRVNAQATRQLAESAAKAGVRRFVFISTIGVHGVGASGEAGLKPIRETDPPNPKEPYAVAKLEAENAIQEVAAKSGMEFTIIRPPLVYGSGVPGNMRQLLGLVRKAPLLPFGGVYNKRSLVGVRNLASVLVRCLSHPGTKNHAFVVADEKPLSTQEMCVLLAAGMKRNIRMAPVPVGLAGMVARALGRERLFLSLFGSLVVDPSTLYRQLEWRPTETIEDGLKAMGAWYAEASP